MGGDFKLVRFPEERSRGGGLEAMRRFSKVLEDLELRDFPLMGGGGAFTWRSSRGWIGS